MDGDGENMERNSYFENCKLENLTEDGIREFFRYIEMGKTAYDAFDHVKTLDNYMLDDEDWKRISDGYLDDEDGIQADDNNDWVKQYIELHPDYADYLYGRLNNLWGYRVLIW